MNNTQDNVILTRFLRIGDRVCMNMGKDARDWGRKGVPDGTRGTVVGFTSYEHHYSRRDGWMQKPGKYRINGAAVIQWDNGEVDNEGGGDICFVGEAVKEAGRRNDDAWNEAFDRKVRIGDLPELECYEDDVVVLRRPLFYDAEDQRTVCLARIYNIRYDDMGRRCNDDVTPYPFLDIEAVDGNQGTTAISLSDIVEIHQRGLHWMWEHDRDNIQFKDIQQKAQFFTQLGFREELRNPRTNNYAWTKDEALHAIRNGEADAFGLSGGFFGSSPKVCVYRFPEQPELAAELRAETMRGFVEV